MLGSAISRRMMKSLILSPASSGFSPVAAFSSKSTTGGNPFGLFSSLASKSNFLFAKNPISHPLKPAMLSPSIFPVQKIPGLQSQAFSSSGSSPSSHGEIHVIVGPMFAGKTTTLLRRIQSETDSGSFQVKNLLLLSKTLKSLCYSGRTSEAVALLWHSGVEVDHGTYALLLQECIFREQFKKGRRIHSQMVVVGYVPNEYLKTKLLILYAKLGDLRTANVLFDELGEESVISWNAMIAGFVQKGLEEMGLSLYDKMRQNGLIPDQFTFASVFRACAALARLEIGKQAHGVMIKCHLRENVVVNSALMDMYFKCSNLSDGHKVFDKSLNRNTVTWTSLIAGYGQHGRVDEVLESFHRMIDEGFRPNYVTFLAVLSACSHGGLVDVGWNYFLSMKRDYGIQPRGKHYAAMVDLLGRAGRLQEAYEFVLNSPCKEHSVLWGSLLAACRMHGDMELVRIAADRFFELQPENPGKYVVLSNAYAMCGFWDNVAEVRGMMRDLGIIKEPAYSRVEVQEEIHSFLIGDNSHKKSEEIYEKVIEMTCILKDADYVPDISDNYP